MNRESLIEKIESCNLIYVDIYYHNKIVLTMRTSVENVEYLDNGFGIYGEEDSYIFIPDGKIIRTSNDVANVYCGDFNYLITEIE